MESIISVVGILGIGSLFGAWLTHVLGKKAELDRASRDIRENKYCSSLVWMRCFIAPERIKHFNIEEPYIKEISTPEDVKKYSREKLEEFYYNSLLYAPDSVNIAFKNFIDCPSENLFIELAIAMRKDLWGKDSNLYFDDIVLAKEN
ncbi:MAG: hypothetical protein ACYTFK_11355 [Planctomycetota bacterium]|jgi:hypothetical protein